MSRSRLAALLVLAEGLLLARAAQAGSPVVVLDFGGAHGPAVRATLVRALSPRHQVMGTDAIEQACRELGIQLTRGPGLARAATHAGAVAVIAGAVRDGQLGLAVFSARTGDVVSKGQLRCRARLRRPALRRALTLIISGLEQCPDPPAAARPDPAPAAPPDPVPAPDSPPAAFAPPNPTPAPDPRSPRAPTLAFDPDAVIDGAKAPGPATESDDFEVPGEPPRPDPARIAQMVAAVKKPPPPARRSPWVVATVGLGGWDRSLRMNDHDSTVHPEPRYASKVALALSAGLAVRPGAGLASGFWSRLYSRLHFRTMLGLKSASLDGTSTMDTSLWELCWEVAGYDWQIVESPHLELGAGFGMLSFALEPGGDRHAGPGDRHAGPGDRHAGHRDGQAHLQSDRRLFGYLRGCLLRPRQARLHDAVLYRLQGQGLRLGPDGVWRALQLHQREVLVVLHGRPHRGVQDLRHDPMLG